MWNSNKQQQSISLTVEILTWQALYKKNLRPRVKALMFRYKYQDINMARYKYQDINMVKP